MITEEDIVDEMLAVLGEGGVSTLNTLHPSVVMAKRILRTQDIEFQSRGWWFNREQNLTLVPNVSGEVDLPADILSFTVTGVENMTVTEKTRYVMRGRKIYDTITHSKVIGATVVANIVTRIPVADMPAAASNYLRCKCVEEIYTADDGDGPKAEKLQRARIEAWQLLKATDLTVTATNALDNPHARKLLSGYVSPIGQLNLTGGDTR